MSYQFIDAYGSVLTADAAVVGGAQQPIVQVGSIFGSLNASIVGTVPVTQSGAWTTSVVGGVSVLGGNVGVTQLGVWSTSVVGVLQTASILGTYAEDTAHATNAPGLFTLGVRNDNVSSLVSADFEYVGTARDSAGRTLIRPFAAEEARIEGYNSVVSTSVTTLVAAAGTGLRNYITDVWVANSGSSATLITFRSQGGASVLGYTMAPAGGGSNIIGLNTPIRTGVNETFDFQPTTASSILFATVKGYRAP